MPCEFKEMNNIFFFVFRWKDITLVLDIPVITTSGCCLSKDEFANWACVKCICFMKHSLVRQKCELLWISVVRAASGAERCGARCARAPRAAGAWRRRCCWARASRRQTQATAPAPVPPLRPPRYALAAPTTSPAAMCPSTGSLRQVHVPSFISIQQQKKSTSKK